MVTLNSNTLLHLLDPAVKDMLEASKAELFKHPLHSDLELHFGGITVAHELGLELWIQLEVTGVRSRL